MTDAQLTEAIRTHRKRIDDFRKRQEQYRRQRDLPQGVRHISTPLKSVLADIVKQNKGKQ